MTGRDVNVANSGVDPADEVIVEPKGEGGQLQNPNILALPVTIRVSVGGAKLTVQEILDLQPTSVIGLNSHVDDPVEVYVGDRRIARGELVETDEENGALGLRITKLCNAPA